MCSFSSTLIPYSCLNTVHESIISLWIDKSVPRVTVWHHEALPRLCVVTYLHTFRCADPEGENGGAGNPSLENQGGLDHCLPSLDQCIS